MAREVAVRELEDEKQDLVSAKVAHLDEAKEAKDKYIAMYEAAPHDKYAALTSQFNNLPPEAFMADGRLDETSPHYKTVVDFAQAASGFVAGQDTDYQQDKHYPCWMQGAQPGPT